MLTHLLKQDVLTSAEVAKIKDAGGLKDQVNMLTAVVTNKDRQGSDVLHNFIKTSESQVAQLILHHGKRTERGLAPCIGTWLHRW